MEQHEKKLVLSIEEAAKVLGISRTLGYQAAKTGELPTIRIGGRILVSRRVIEKMLDGNEHFDGRFDKQSTSDVQP